MERAEEVGAGLATTDRVDSLDREIGVLRERLQEVRMHIDGCWAQLDRTEQEVQAVAVSLGWRR